MIGFGTTLDGKISAWEKCPITFVQVCTYIILYAFLGAAHQFKHNVIGQAVKNYHKYISFG